MSVPVTCIIPVHNGEKTIERAVESALVAGCDEVLIFNDASTDNTQGVMDSLDFPYIVCFYGSNIRSGVNYARNLLIDAANDGFIIPLDCDDTLNDIKPLKSLCSAESWVYGDYLETDGKYETLITGAPSIALTRKNISGITFIFHKSAWEKVGGYDPDFAYAEDYGFQCALTNAGIQPVYINHTIYNRHLKSEGNERTVLAGQYWDFYHKMAQQKYPNLFTINR